MLSLCLKHFNERINGKLTEQDVTFRQAVCEECKVQTACVLSYKPAAIPATSYCITLDDSGLLQDPRTAR